MSDSKISSLLFIQKLYLFILLSDIVSGAFVLSTKFLYSFIIFLNRIPHSLMYLYHCVLMKGSIPETSASPHFQWRLAYLDQCPVDSNHVSETPIHASQIGRSSDARMHMHLVFGVLSGSISWRTLKITWCPSWREGELLPAPWTIYKFLLSPTQWPAVS